MPAPMSSSARAEVQADQPARTLESLRPRPRERAPRTVSEGDSLILRLDKWGTLLPPPSDSRPGRCRRRAGADGRALRRDVDADELHVPVVQLPGPQQLRPFYDLIANIAAEEYGHIELVAGDDQLAAHRGLHKGLRAAQRRGQSAPLPQGAAGRSPVDSIGRRGRGTTSSPPATWSRTLPHNYFLETGARNGKLKVYEMVEHPAARALTGYLLVRGGVHQIAYARALELLTGVDISQRLSRRRGSRPPRFPSASRTSRSARTRRSTASHPTTTRRSSPSSRGRTPKPARRCVVEDGPPGGLPPAGPAAPGRGLRPRPLAERDRRDRQEAAQGSRTAGEARGGSRPEGPEKAASKRKNAELAPSNRGRGSAAIPAPAAVRASARP